MRSPLVAIVCALALSGCGKGLLRKLGQIPSVSDSSKNEVAKSDPLPSPPTTGESTPDEEPPPPASPPANDPTTVTGVTTTAANGVHGIGAIVNIDVAFSATVTVTGNPSLLLETGVNDRTAVYLSGSGSDKLRFRYLVQENDLASDLNYSSETALTGNIQGPGNVDADLTLPALDSAGALASGANLQIDGLPPRVVNVTSTKANGTYGQNAVINIQVVFSEPVTTSGGSGLLLETVATGSDPSAGYFEGSGTDTLVYQYTVHNGEASVDLDYHDVGALTVGSGYIRDAAGNDARLSLASPGSPTSLGANKAIVINTVGPSVSGIGSSKPDGAYGVNEIIPIDITFQSAVFVNGIPKLLMETGSNDTAAVYISGSGTTTLRFNYTVTPGDETSLLDYVSSGALLLDGGSITDSLGNDANVNLSAPGTSGSFAALKSIAIDAVGAKVMSVTSTDSGTYNFGDTVIISVHFTKAVTVTGSPRLHLETGNVDGTAIYYGGTGSTTLTFNYQVGEGEETDDLNYASTDALDKFNGGIYDELANSASLTLPALDSGTALTYNRTIRIDGVAPRVTQITSTLANGSYGTGKDIPIQVVFSEPVTLASAATLALNNLPAGALATYVDGSGTDTLNFTYRVRAGDSAEDLDVTGTSALAATDLYDLAGNAPNPLVVPAPGSPGSLGNNKNFLINAVAPTADNVTSSATNGSYRVGQLIPITVRYNRAITVTGSPKLELATGSQKGYANYSGGSGSTTLSFDYVVGPQEVSSDLDTVGPSAILLNGGTLRDAYGNDAVLDVPNATTMGSLSLNKDIVIDGSSVTVTSVNSSTADGTYTAGDTIVITVSFSGMVSMAERARLTLNNGAVLTTASGPILTTSLTFTYVVDESDAAVSDLDYSSTYALNAHAAPLTGPSNGNAAILTLPTPGAANSLGANRNIAIARNGATPTLAYEYNGLVPGALLGSGMAALGDIDADGKGDFLVGQKGVENGTGLATVLRGSDGLNAYSISGSGVGDQTGAAVAGIGDVNADGVPDYIVGSPGNDDEGSDRGKIVVYSGRTHIALWVKYGDQDAANFGYAVAGLGDVNHDGYTDFAVAEPFHNAGGTRRGRVQIFSGKTGSSIFYLTGTADDDQFGISLAGVGDLNRDGTPDLIVGAVDMQNQSKGRVTAFNGTGLKMYELSGHQASSLYGKSVAGVGDVNGDGKADFIVGEYMDGVDGRGSYYVHNGESGEVLYVGHGNEFQGGLGFAVAGAGDVDGDGRPDFIVGEPGGLRTSGGVKGIVHVYSGRTGETIYTLNGNYEGDAFGHNVAGAGDINGDGRADFMASMLVGGRGKILVYYSAAPTAPSGSATSSFTLDGSSDGGKLGFSVASAGDVNGDGLDDVIVGEPYYVSNGGTHYGRIHVLNGLTGATLYTKEGITNTGEFGYSVTKLGDINHDGKSDFAVGEPAAAQGMERNGRVAIYSGADGQLLRTIWGPSDTAVSNDMEGTRFGQVVAEAGDVNGDGTPDILVGAPLYEARGAVFVFSGTDGNGIYSLTGGIADSQFGISVSSVGDINRDGRPDFIVGQPYGTVLGQATIYSGADSTSLHTFSGSGGQFGYSVAGLGDVNGDGRPDVIVGEPSATASLAGEIHVYSGADWNELQVLIGTQAGMAFGRVVAGTGDVDGDGRNDFLVSSGIGALNVYSGAAGAILHEYLGLESGSYFGYAAAGAGDVNGDGRADIIQGEALIDLGGQDRGRAGVYLSPTR